jgi:malate dehydrogenase
MTAGPQPKTCPSLRYTLVLHTLTPKNLGCTHQIRSPFLIVKAVKNSLLGLKADKNHSVAERSYRMKITIIGAAGSVGAPVAFYIGASGLVDEILMIGGTRQNVLKQHAMDISTALSGKDIRVMAGTYEDMRGSEIVINAAGAPQGLITDRMEMLPKNIPLIRHIVSKVRQYCPEAFVITVTNPVDPLNYATYLAGDFDRRKVIGYSFNDSYRFREMLAVAYGVKPNQVEGTVIGEHGNTQVLLFSSVRIDGQPVETSEAVKQSIRAEVPNILKRYEELQSGRTAGWTCAVGLAAITRAVVEDRGETIPCSVVLDGEYGLRELSMSVPAVIDRLGVREVRELALAPDELEGLKVTTDMLRKAMKAVEECLI